MAVSHNSELRQTFIAWQGVSGKAMQVAHITGRDKCLGDCVWTYPEM